MSPAPLFIILLLLLSVVAFVLLVVFVLVPVFRGVGWCIVSIFSAIGFVIMQIVEFIGGMIGDTLRFVGAVIPMVPLALLAVMNVIIGRWSAAGHYAEAVKRECQVAGACLYRICLRRPLKLFWLHGLLEGVEERMPEAMYGSPTSDKPPSRVGQFDGYTIVGSLRGGGSGGKLYIARPDEHKLRRLTTRHEHVVIKSFALTEGSSLPQIVRESRALEAAKQLGHVLDHGMDEGRFFYVMPYHPGDHLGIVTRQLHGESGSDGLAGRELSHATGYVRDLVATLSHYHKGGLWHKDVKPENIIVHDGRAHLVDLGLVTPLKSAMTLTTHGTEYFRDPEMVRQALRGVKVHQVNGAKFDIYAAGAVLYFVLENTFPAHGGLSRFSARSPEALRWIVRRAMAEYNQRYDHADLMLADLEFVASASDAFAIKPADLPSMRSGGSVPDFETTTTPPPVAPVQEPEFVAARAGSPSPTHRPKLRVTNWWTGEYASAAEAAAPSSADGLRTVREKVAAARARARELRDRSKAVRHQVGIERQPSGALIAVVLCVVFVLVFAIITALNSQSKRTTALMAESNVMLDQSNKRSERALNQINAYAEEALATARQTSKNIEASLITHATPPATPDGQGLSYLLINDHPAKNDFLVHARVQAIVKEYEARGWVLLMNDPDTVAAIRRHLPARTEHLDITPLLANALAEHDLNGILYIDATPGEAPAHERVRVRELAAVQEITE